MERASQYVVLVAKIALDTIFVVTYRQGLARFAF